MIVNGIIAEYNPFHTGHAYQLSEAKASTKADYTVVIMSGNYVQRGTPAIADKYLRARMALEGGADLVLELPHIFSTGSAEYFATGAVSLLNRLGVVNHLCFGSETGHLEKLQQIAAVLIEQPAIYKTALQNALKTGKSFPAAREIALRSTLEKKEGATISPSVDTVGDKLSSQLSGSLDLSLLAGPNNVLSIEYLKALRLSGSTMQPHITFREGLGYHTEALTGKYVSAQALRSKLQQIKGNSSSVPEESDAFKSLLEELSCYTNIDVLQEYLQAKGFLSENDFSQALYLRLLEESPASIQQYLDVTETLANRIYSMLPQYTSFSNFCERLKTKDMTYTRISRSLLHILLQIPPFKPDDQGFLPNYIRVLGFRKTAAPLLTEIGRNTSLQLLSKPADAREKLSEKDYHLFNQQLKADMLYAQAAVRSKNALPTNEFTSPIIII